MLGNTMRYGCKDKFLFLVWVPGFFFLRTTVEARIVERIFWTFTARDKYWLALYLVTRRPSNLSIFFFHKKVTWKRKKSFSSKPATESKDQYKKSPKQYKGGKQYRQKKILKTMRAMGALQITFLILFGEK